MTDQPEQDWLLREAQEHFDLPLRYDPDKGWVDAKGKPVKSHKWADIKRKPKPPALVPRVSQGLR